MQNNPTPLRRDLTTTSAISIVIGTVIGTGIFLKSASMTQLLGSASWVILAWIAAGLLSIAGTLTYAELAAMMPESGGPYVYLRTAYGKLPAFVFGWKELLATKGAGNAAVAVAIAIFLSSLIPFRLVWAQHTFHMFGEQINWQFGTQQLEAIAFIVILSAINCISVSAGGRFQTLVTGLKLLGIAFLIVGAFFFARGASWAHFQSHLAGAGSPGIAAFGAAMIAAMWAYSGWGDLPIAGGEVRSPGKTIPFGLIAGILVVMAIYVVANIAYVYVLPLADLATSSSTAFPNAAPVAARVAQAFLGIGGAAFLSLLFVVSALGTLNGGILTGSRVPFAMAGDRLLPEPLAQVNPQTRTPVTSIIVLAVWACIVALSGTFDQITTLIIFVDVLLDFFGAASIFILRRTMVGAERPFRTPLYPLVPIAYVATLGWLVFNTIATSPAEAFGGLAIIVVGLPVYLYYRSKEVRGTSPNAAQQP
ncbi:MAG TPA: amino acid permease [Candidatus Eremiobacteraceae bacterium]|nr:amino acid permease [Candidatus Eremiobacteraceae bacterium]